MQLHEQFLFGSRNANKELRSAASFAHFVFGKEQVVFDKEQVVRGHEQIVCAQEKVFIVPKMDSQSCFFAQHSFFLGGNTHFFAQQWP